MRSCARPAFRRVVSSGLPRIPNPESRVPIPGEASPKPLQEEAAAKTGASMIRSGVAGTLRMSRPRLRIALTTAGATPSNGISPTPFAPYGPCAYGFSTITTSIGGVSSVVGTM